MNAHYIISATIRANRCNIVAVTRALNNCTLAGLRAAWAVSFPGAKTPTSRTAFIAYICERERPYV